MRSGLLRCRYGMLRAQAANGRSLLERRGLLDPCGQGPVHPTADDPVSLTRWRNRKRRIRKVRHAVVAHTPRELDVDDPRTLRRFLGAADRARLQLRAIRQRVLVGGGLRVDRGRKRNAAVRAGVGETGHTMRTHAVGKRDPLADNSRPRRAARLVRRSTGGNRQGTDEGNKRAQQLDALRVDHRLGSSPSPVTPM